MKKFYLSIFWKFLIAIILTVTFFAFLNIKFVWNKVFNTIDLEISKRIIFIGKNLANQSLSYILYNDISTLQTITDDTKNSDPIIEYCIILDSDNKVLAHTFTQGFPKKLLDANRLKAGDSLSMVNIRAENFSSKNIKDVLIPVLDGKVGFVRIGINDDTAWLDLENTLITFVLIFIAFILLGFLGAFIFSYLISKPIKRIKFVTEVIDIDNLDTKYYTSKQESKRNFFLSKLKITDEIDDLSEKFNEMVERLGSTYNKLKSTQNAMNQSEKLASIGTLVSGIAHEINNPLSGLQSCIRRIAANPDNVTQNIKYINIMNETTAKIQNVVNGLLDFSRVSNKQKEKNDLIKLIENATNLIKYRKSNNAIEISFKKPASEVYLLCNKNEMEQVLFSLLKNAIEGIEEKYNINDKHIGKIEITLSISDTAINIDILDNGIGITNENLSKVFDPFFTTKDVGKGTGLGCSICYNIVKDHDGEISIESEYLKWTLVKLCFKLK